MRALIIGWLMRSLWWAPLAALIVTSLGLVALKRMSNLPPWLARLIAPPFYLVSLPIATLTAGAGMLGLYLLVALDLLFIPGFSGTYCTSNLSERPPSGWSFRSPNISCSTPTSPNLRLR